LLPRARALDEAALRHQPVARRAARLGADDLDAAPALPDRIERHDVPIAPGTAAAVAEIAVQRVGEVDRRTAGRQVDHLALRREHVHRVVQPGLPGGARPVGDLVAPREQLAQPRDLLLERAVGALRFTALLVAPVRRDAELGMPVHLLGADLHLYRLARRTDHRSVQGLVQVSLRAGDVVVEFLRDRLPQVLHHAERGIAVLHRRHDDAQRAHVVDLAEVERLVAHLVPDRVDVLRAAVDLAFHARRLELAREQPDGSPDVLLALQALLVEHAGDALVELGLEEAGRHVLELPFQLEHAEPVRERRIDVEALAGIRLALGDRAFIALSREPAQGLRAAREAYHNHA